MKNLIIVGVCCFVVGVGVGLLFKNDKRCFRAGWKAGVGVTQAIEAGSMDGVDSLFLDCGCL